MEENQNFGSVCILQQVPSEFHAFMDANIDGLFFRVPHTIISHVEGVGICTVNMSFNEQSDTCVFVVTGGN